jgi:RNA polymerase sigma-70 factor (ECF subfamily)
MEARADRFRRLLEPHHDRVLGFARCLTRATADGDDVFQDAMLHAFRKLDGLRDDAAFRPWLYRIVINAHRSRCRRAIWRRWLPLAEAPEDERLDRTAWQPEIVEANLRARSALAKLPPAVREAIVLFEIEGFQVDEIAALQGGSASAVKSRLARGRTHLRALYDAEPALVPALKGST